MAKLSVLVLLLALGLVSTVSARHLLFNVGENMRASHIASIRPLLRHIHQPNMGQEVL